MARQTMNAESGTTTPSNSDVKIGKNEMNKPAVATTSDENLFEASSCEQVDPAWCESQGFSGRLFKRVLEDGSTIAYLVLLAPRVAILRSIGTHSGSCLMP